MRYIVKAAQMSIAKLSIVICALAALIRGVCLLLTWATSESVVLLLLVQIAVVGNNARLLAEDFKRLEMLLLLREIKVLVKATSLVG